MSAHVSILLLITLWASLQEGEFSFSLRSYQLRSMWNGEVIETMSLVIFKVYIYCCLVFCCFKIILEALSLLHTVQLLVSVL